MLTQNAFAEEACERNVVRAERMIPSGNRADFLTGLNVSMIMALTPDTFPDENINDIKHRCSVSTTSSTSATFSLFGSKSEIPSRWATLNNRERTAYIAIAPPPNVALAWYNETGGRGAAFSFTQPPIYVAAVADGVNREIYAFFLTMPSDQQVELLFNSALNRDAKKLASFNVTTNKLDITSSPSDW